MCELSCAVGKNKTVTDGVSVGHSYTDTGSEGLQQEAGSVKTNTITLGKYVTPEEAYMNGLDIPEPKDALTTLWNSTAAFHKRFDTMSELGFLEAQHRVLFEEFAEFTYATHSGTSAADEIADTLVVAIGLLIHSGYTLNQLQFAIRAVAAKNDAKTTETHAKDAKGKVARKTA